jgi:hypothetical protein
MCIDRPNIFKLIHSGSYLSNLWVFLGSFVLKIWYVKREIVWQLNQPTGSQYSFASNWHALGEFKVGAAAA